MNKRERQEVIATAVQAAGRARVTELSERTGVSEMTVRRDLEEREAPGLLVRVHGGAVSTISRSFEPGFAVRSQQNVDAKVRIGWRRRSSSATRRPSSSMPARPCTWPALRPEIHVRVMAPSLHVAGILADQPNVTLMLPGAIVRPYERSLMYEFDDAETKRAALRSARRTIVVADASKLGAVAFVKLCPIDDVDVVVTDSRASAAQVDALRAAGVEMIVAQL